MTYGLKLTHILGRSQEHFINGCSSLEPRKTNQVKAPALPMEEEPRGRDWGWLDGVGVNSASEYPNSLDTPASSCDPLKVLKGGLVSLGFQSRKGGSEEKRLPGD